MAERIYTLSDFDFHLPQYLLAETPAASRDASRLMVINRTGQFIRHSVFSEIASFFHPGDLLVMNNTRVIPARLTARKEHLIKGALIDVLLVRESESRTPGWIMLLDPLRKLTPGHKLLFGSKPITGVYTQRLGDRECLVTFPEFTDPMSLRDALFALGNTPLPPYIKRKPDALDQERYQTVYAKNYGALAAPTAGLHFTPGLLDTLAHFGVKRTEVTLHVGLGTFYPIHEENLHRIIMHEERYHISPGAAEEINQLDKKQHLLCAVGTTSLRTLETASAMDGTVAPGGGMSQLFIRPPYQFKTANALITNFHTPRSTLLMMIAAYMGYEFTMHAYSEAIREEYRFFSYGDAMLILP